MDDLRNVDVDQQKRRWRTWVLSVEDQCHLECPAWPSDRRLLRFFESSTPKSREQKDRVVCCLDVNGGELCPALTAFF